MSLVEYFFDSHAGHAAPMIATALKAAAPEIANAPKAAAIAPSALKPAAPEIASAPKSATISHSAPKPAAHKVIALSLKLAKKTAADAGLNPLNFALLTAVFVLALTFMFSALTHNTAPNALDNLIERPPPKRIIFFLNAAGQDDNIVYSPAELNPVARAPYFASNFEASQHKTFADAIGYTAPTDFVQSAALDDLGSPSSAEGG